MLTYLVAIGECSATSHVERLSSNATNNVERARSADRGLALTPSMRGHLALVSGPRA
jgi:hypothetical protein